VAWLETLCVVVHKETDERWGRGAWLEASCVVGMYIDIGRGILYGHVNINFLTCVGHPTWVRKASDVSHCVHFVHVHAGTQV
jgi:hypothetical protein